MELDVYSLAFILHIFYIRIYKCVYIYIICILYIYILYNMLFTTEGLFAGSIEIWPEWDLNP